MIHPKVKAGCGVLTVFALGFGLGVISLLIVLVNVIPLSEGWKTKESKEFVTKQLAKQLRLTEEQRVKFDPIVDEMLEQRWTVRRSYLLEDRKIMEEDFIPRVREILTEEQREHAKKLLERWRREQRFKLEPEVETEVETESTNSPAEEPQEASS